MNRDYTQLFEAIHANKGEWLVVEGGQLTGPTAAAHQKALCRAAKQRRCMIQTRLRGTSLSVRLAHEGRMSDVLERVGRRRPMNKRVPLKKIYGPKWFRVKDDKANCASNMKVIRWRSNLYMVSPNVEVPAKLQNALSHVDIFCAITSRNQYFLLYIFKNGGRWCRSAIAAARVAMDTWIKVERDPSVGYIAVTGCARSAEPNWEKLPCFDAMLASAFRDRIINDAAHPALRRMLGLEPAEILFT